MHPNSVLLFGRYAAHLFRGGMRVLEVGPDAVPSTFQIGIGTGPITWETVDLSGRADVTHEMRDDMRFPMEDDRYDIVFSSQVIEHVRRVWLWVPELARVCKPGGYVITINPVSWPYHEAPIDCWRIFPEGMRALYEDAGLRVLMSRFETLEVDVSRGGRLFPGTSAAQGRLDDFKRLVKRIVGWPITCAFDAITIGVKESDRVHRS